MDEQGTDLRELVATVGYYVGYAIVSRYHARAADKAAAIKSMIELYFADQEAVERFVDESGYFRDADTR